MARFVLARMLVNIGRIRTPASLMVTGARFQDKKTSQEFPAAHAIPCDLLLDLPGQGITGVRLYDLLRDPFSRTWVRLEIFGQTDRVHRLTNIADRRCEEGGMISAFAAACDTAILDGLRAATLAAAGARSAPVSASVAGLFERTLVPAFIATAALAELETEFTVEEREHVATAPLLDRFGKPIAARPTDTRLGSPDAEARAKARSAIRQVLQTYADPGLVDRAALSAIAGKIDALRLNERGF
jgi:hypothetical protein